MTRSPSKAPSRRLVPDDGGGPGPFPSKIPPTTSTQIPEDKPDIKFALHMYRYLLTGLHLMKTRQLVVHLPTLNAEALLSHVDELIARRKRSPEYRNLDPREIKFCGKEFDRLTGEIQKEASRSTMTGYPDGKTLLNDLLIRIRKSGLTT